MALGASIGQLVLGRRIGRAAPLIGAALGTLPDLDVVIPYGGAVENFTYHRSFSHSLLVLTLAAPLIARLIARLMRHRAPAITYGRWWLLTWLVLITHPLLDGFTIYGTQLLWPITEHPFSGSVIFIIDPLYTGLLLAGLLFAMLRGSRRAHWLNTLGLVCSTLYLGWACYAKLHVEQLARASLDRQGVSYQKLIATPMPFNTIGWRIIARQDDSYVEAYYSLLDETPEIAVDIYPSDETLLQPIADHWPVKRLQWFTHGFYKAEQVGDDVVIKDIRMGIEGSYVFGFKVGEVIDGDVRAVVNSKHPIAVDFDRIKLIARRVLGEPVSLAPRQSTD
jgi:inner membrane protein